MQTLTPALLHKIQQRHALASAGQWGLGNNTQGDTLCVKEGDNHPVLDLAVFNPLSTFDDRIFLAGAYDDMAILLNWVSKAMAAAGERKRLAEEANQKQSGNLAADGKDYAKQAAICCNADNFQNFLFATSRLPHGSAKAEIENYVRNTCGVTTRKDLNTNPAATEKWKQLHRQFWDWNKAQEKED